MQMQELEIVVVDGEAWYPFSVAYEVDGKTYSTVIYGKSWEHAEHIVAAMRSSLTVFGQLLAVVDNPEQVTRH